MQAAQTGHLVLSTLHTDDAPSCVTRLTDIGVESYVSASALVGVIAQRLVRRLCTHCRRPYTPESKTLRAMSVTEAEAATMTWYRAVGCDQCNQTGYRGRVGIYELMPVTDELRRHIALKGSEAQPPGRRAVGRDASARRGWPAEGEGGGHDPGGAAQGRHRSPRDQGGLSRLRGECGSGLRRVSRVWAQRRRGLPALRAADAARPLQARVEFCAYCAKSAAPSVKRKSRKLASKPEVPQLPAAGNVAEFKK